MNAPWAVVALTGIITVVLKGLGPALLGGRPLPPRLLGALSLLAPAVLAALIATAIFGGDRRLVLDARVAGLLAAAIAIWRKAPILLV
ncbi:MAG: hypothetical protein QOG64_1254, partial [Acidimicrobiaceae bacterium]|nr:hypothetical protein [Acidimicrobiaceae bacterium]